MVEMGQEGLGTIYVLDDQKSILEVLSEGQILVAISFALWISASSNAFWGTGFTSCDLLACGGPTDIFQLGVPWSTNINFRPWFCFPLPF